MRAITSSSPARCGLLLVALLLAACAPASPRATSSGEQTTGAGTAPTTPARTLVAAVRVEPSTVAIRGLGQAGVALYLSKRLFNAELAILDDKGSPQAYLAETLPQLNTPSWQVFPDGRMETTYKLKPNITWHDGAPLTAEDFVFAWRVFMVPEFGEASTPPFTSIDEVAASDPQTLLIRWRRPHPDAGALVARGRELPPLPRHLLAQSFQEDSPEAFGNHPFWTRQYVGLGPYKLDRWEPGAFMEASTFDGHILGRAKIARFKIVFISDGNTTLANLLAGEVQLSADTSIRLENVATLKRVWGPRNLGSVIQHPNQWRAAHFQFRPDYVSSRALLDVRVRRALAHAVDKASINEAVNQGDGIFADSMVPSLSEFGPMVERIVAKYPFDLRRSEQLMSEAGFSRPGGVYTSPTDGRIATDLKTNAAADNEQEIAIMAAGWREAGFDITESVLPAALAQDNQARATFPGIFAFNSNIGEAALIGQSSVVIPRPENRWSGSNRAGWSNAEFDRLGQSLNTTLDRAERTQQAAQMVRIYTEDAPSISLFFRTQPWAHVAALRGPALVAPESNVAWNVHEWEYR